MHPTEGSGEERAADAAVRRRGSCGPKSPAKPLGADTRKVLAEAGYSDAEIDALVSSGAAIEAASLIRAAVGHVATTISCLTLPLRRY